jgi:hypothetical protein
LPPPLRPCSKTHQRTGKQYPAALVYLLCAERRLAHHRVGNKRGTIRIREEDLAAFFEGCRVQPTPLGLRGPEALRHIRLK